MIAVSIVKFLYQTCDLHIGLSAENGAVRHCAPPGALNAELRYRLPEQRTKMLHFREGADRLTELQPPIISFLMPAVPALAGAMEIREVCK